MNAFVTGLDLERNDRERLDVVIGRIEFGRAAVADHVEELERVRRIAEKRESALREYAKPIEHLEELAGRLMDGANDGLVLLGQILHAVHKRHGHVGVEAARGLVAKEDRRIRDDLGGERQSPSLAAADAFDAALRIADHRVLALFEVQLKRK